LSGTAFTFTKLAVADLDRAVTFYSTCVGLRLLKRFVADEGPYAQEEAVLVNGNGERGPMLLLVRYLSRPAPPPGAAWLGFSVVDLDGTIAAVERAGGAVLVPVHEALGMRIAVVADREGHPIELTTPLDGPP